MCKLGQLKRREAFPVNMGNPPEKSENCLFHRRKREERATKAYAGDHGICMNKSHFGQGLGETELNSQLTPAIFYTDSDTNSDRKMPFEFQIIIFYLV